MVQGGHGRHYVELPAELIGHDIANDEVDPSEFSASGTYDISVEVNGSDLRQSLGQLLREEAVARPDVEPRDRFRRYRSQHHLVVMDVVVPASLDRLPHIPEGSYGPDSPGPIDTGRDPDADVNALRGLKFSAALPPELAQQTLAACLGDAEHAREVLVEKRSIVRSMG